MLFYYMHSQLGIQFVFLKYIELKRVIKLLQYQKYY